MIAFHDVQLPERNFLKIYIYNYPSSFHLGGGVGATHFVVALRPPILYGKTCHFCGSAHPEVFPPASGEIPELFLVISTGTSPTVKEKPIAIFDCQVMGIHNWDILWYVMDLNSRIIPCSDNYWRLMGIWIDTIHLERERETPKKLPIFFSAWTYSNFLQPLSPWINYTFPHLLVGFEVFFLKTDEIYENIWEPISNAIYVVLDSNWTI